MQNDVTDATATAFPRNAISSAAFAVGSRGRTRRCSTPCRSWCCAGSKTSRSSGPPSGSSPSSLRPRGGFRNSLCEGHVGRLEESRDLGVTFQKFRKIPASFAFWRFEFVEIFFFCFFLEFFRKTFHALFFCFSQTKKLFLKMVLFTLKRVSFT